MNVYSFVKFANNKKIKRHGFMRPFHYYQIGSWIYFLFNTTTFYMIQAILYGFSPFAQFILILIQSILIIETIYLTIKATMADPTDELVYEERTCRMLQ